MNQKLHNAVSDWFVNNNQTRPTVIVVTATTIQCRLSNDNYSLASLLKFCKDFRIKPENLEMVVDDYTTWITAERKNHE